MRWRAGDDRQDNPFRPGYGTPPQCFAGRDDVLYPFHRSLGSSRSLDHSILLTGDRGMGKTALMAEMGEMAREQGWAVIDTSCAPDFLEELVKVDVIRALRERRGEEWLRTVTGVSTSVLGVGASASTTASPRFKHELNLRWGLAELADAVRPQPGAGVLLTVDEVRSEAVEDLRRVGQAVQMNHRQNNKVVVVLAGLPEDVTELVNAEGLTFLSRSRLVELDYVTDSEVAAALQQTASMAGRDFTPEALDAATDATQGYPFLLQVVGYQSWEQANGEPTINLNAVQRAIPAAVNDMAHSVHQLTFSQLTDVERAYLQAMSFDNGPSSVTDLAGRLGVSRQYINRYAARLEDAGHIRRPGRGLVAYSGPPYLREAAQASFARDLQREHRQTRTNKQPGGLSPGWRSALVARQKHQTTMELTRHAFAQPIATSRNQTTRADPPRPEPPQRQLGRDLGRD